MGGIYVAGSIATDHLMHFPGRFADQFLAERLDTVSLSFLVDGLDIRRGGAGANIAYGMASLGLRPHLVGAVGPDFADHRARLEEHGVDCSALHTSRTAYTARFICTTDEQQCQIASFYPGAMAEAGTIDLAAVVRAAGDSPDLVLVAPDAPAAMLRHAGHCRRAGWPFVADPSQQVAVMSGPAIREFISGASHLFTNEYEYGLLLQKCGLDDDSVLDLVTVLVTTRGDQGVSVRDRHSTVSVPAVKAPGLIDPTGAGDALRAGYLAATSRGLARQDAAAVGCQLAWFALQHKGGQGYELTLAAFCDELTANYGPGLAGSVAAAFGPDQPPFGARRVGPRLTR